MDKSRDGSLWMRAFKKYAAGRERLRGRRSGLRAGQGLERLESRRVLAGDQDVDPFVITSPADLIDPNDGQITIREALINANQNADANTITFAVSGEGPHSIQVNSQLPTILHPVTIDGYSQGAHTPSDPADDASPNNLGPEAGTNAVLKIELNGTNAGAARGLVIVANNCIVRGLLINAFQIDGITIDGSNNRIQGNFLGVNFAGTSALGTRQGGNGIAVRGGTDNIIGVEADGSNDAAERNLVSNFFSGITIYGPSTATTVAGNLVGTNAAGTAAIANTLGVSLLTGTTDNRIGTRRIDPTIWERNIISGNIGFGIIIGAQTSVLESHQVLRTQITGNRIGTNVTGSLPLANGVGVGINSGEDNLVGVDALNLVDPALANLIAHNGVGVSIGSNNAANPGVHTGTHNTVRGNFIYQNSGLGIDLNQNGADGVTVNDLNDLDGETNDKQNFPIISLAAVDDSLGDDLTIAGTVTLNSTSNSSFTVDFYAGRGNDCTTFLGSCYGEGKYYLGTLSVTTDGSGNSTESFSFPLPNVSLDLIRAITATATNAGGSTSEFSPAFMLDQPLMFGDGGANTISIQGSSDPSAVDIVMDGHSFLSVPSSSGVYVLAGDGADAYEVTFGDWNGEVFIRDTGATGNDSLTIYGTSEDDVLEKQTGFVKWRPEGTPPFLPYPAEVDFAGFDAGESITLVAGEGNDTVHDPGADTIILGGPGDDTIVIDATSGSGIVVNGEGGSDSYVIYLGQLQGPVSITDSGVTGDDVVLVQGTPQDDVVSLAGSSVTSASESITFSATIESLAVDAGDGNDSVEASNLSGSLQELSLSGGTGTDSFVLTDIGTSVNALTVDGGSGTDNDVVQVSGELPPSVTVTNVAPQAAVAGPGLGVPGQPLAFSVSAADLLADDQAAGFTYLASWSDGLSQTIGRSPGNGSGMSLVRSFSAPGVFTVQLTATDQSGATSPVAELQLEIVSVLLQDGVLLAGGTTGDDQLRFRHRDGHLSVRLNGSELGLYPTPDRLIAYTLAGDDTIDVADSVHLDAEVHAGGGRNTVRTGNGDDVITSAEGNDDIDAGGGHNVVNAGSGRNTIRTGSGDDSVTTGDGDDDIDTGSGNDSVFAGHGRNQVDTGSGDDSVTAGDGDDDIDTGSGNDSVSAGHGRNQVETGSGDDSVMTGDGDDDIDSGSGHDIVLAGAGDDTVSAGSGDDLVVGADGRDLLIGDEGRDLLFGGRGSDVLRGQSGDDILIAGFTDFDADLPKLVLLASEWRSSAAYATRVAHVTSGGGGLAGHGVRLDSTTVHDDGACDILRGDSGRDLFFAHFAAGHSDDDDRDGGIENLVLID
ncbi:MAG: hypothetical protein AB7F89_01125 [Pirellulaceae bacterium]